jgi:hypothetical protein
MVRVACSDTSQFALLSRDTIFKFVMSTFSRNYLFNIHPQISQFKFPAIQIFLYRSFVVHETFNTIFLSAVLTNNLYFIISVT